QTRPLPPPGAAVVRAAASGFAFADVVVAAAGAGLGDAFGLNKSANVFFGEADGLAAGDPPVVAFVLRDFFSPGDGDASVAVAAGAAVAKAAFFRTALDAGSVNGWVVAAGDALAAGEGPGVTAAFLCDFFAGDADSSSAPPLAGEASVT